MRPTVGVLITYFNENEMLRECAESLLRQTVPPDEVLIYDDGSEIPAERFLPDDFKGRVIRSSVNHGPSYARNALLNAARSEYVHCHDADDLFAPEWCETVKNEITQTGVGLIITQFSVSENGRTVHERVGVLDELTPGMDLVKFCLWNGMIPSVTTYRLENALKIGGFKEISIYGTGDPIFHTELAATGISFSVVKTPVIIKRNRPGSRSSQNAVRNETELLRAFHTLADSLPARYRPDVAESVARVGIKFLRLGAVVQAREAFAFARKLGPASFAHESFFYRWSARILGPEPAERLAAVYRTAVPEPLRRILRGS